MDPQELLAKISELTKEIEKLPRGYISQKAINGKVYYYHQWSETAEEKQVSEGRRACGPVCGNIPAKGAAGTAEAAALQAEENAKRGDADAICIYAPEDRCVRY